MTLSFASSDTGAIPVDVISVDQLEKWFADQPDVTRNWVRTNGFSGKIGDALVVPDIAGNASQALLGYGSEKSRSRGRFHIAAGASKLPSGTYTITSGISDDVLEQECLGWLLSQYRFDRYAVQSNAAAQLLAPSGVDPHRVEVMANAEALTRTLINTPASDMGPPDLENSARELAKQFKAKIKLITGDALLKQNFPLIHTVGRAADRAPRLIDMHWGKSGPKVTLVGKGVCFDTGGLNLKPGSSMGLMKKDMGGAAAVLGLAHMIMGLNLDLQLRVLVPAVENSVSSNAYRPQDILTSRKGLTVEINNTDAEGRLVLADALALADEENPDLIVSMATLTGAARVAVGPDLAPFYTDDEAMASALQDAAGPMADPVWRMPLHAPYEKMIEPGIANLDNAPSGGFAGSITAALFLKRFVTESPSYTHFDIYGWQPVAAPARPKGGAGQGMRAVLSALPVILEL